MYNPYYDPMHTGNPKAMGGTLFMQDDGNLVMYPNGWVPSDGIDLLEATHTSTASGYSGTAVASLEESGDLVLYDKACGATASCEDGDPAAVHWSYGERGPAGHNVFALTGSFAFIAKETTCLPHMPCNGGTSYCPANTAPMGCKHFPYGCGVMRNGDALQPGDCVYNPRYRHAADGGGGPEGGTLVLQEDGNLAIYANSDGGHQPVETTGTSVAEGTSAGA